MTPKKVSKSFVEWMEANSYGTFGTDIFINQVPDSAIDNAYWVVTAGGDVAANLVTAQNIKEYVIQVNCRNTSGEAVDDNLNALETQVNTRGCFTIDGFDIYSIESSMPDDNDRDAENRRQGLLNITIKIYKSYVS
jgi:hypothetical protein